MYIDIRVCVCVCKYKYKYKYKTLLSVNRQSMHAHTENPFLVISRTYLSKYIYIYIYLMTLESNFKKEKRYDDNFGIKNLNYDKMSKFFYKMVVRVLDISS